MSTGSPTIRSSWITEPTLSCRISCTVMLARPISIATGIEMSSSASKPVAGMASIAPGSTSDGIAGVES